MIEDRLEEHEAERAEEEWRRELAVRAAVVLAVLAVQVGVMWALEDPTRVQVLARRVRLQWDRFAGQYRRERAVRRQIPYVHWLAEDVLREGAQ